MQAPGRIVRTTTPTPNQVLDIVLMQHNATFHRSIGHGVFNADDDEQPPPHAHSRPPSAVPSAVPGLGACACASSGRAPGGPGQLGTPRGENEPAPLGTPPLPRLLERAASTVADSAALSTAPGYALWDTPLLPPLQAPPPWQPARMRYGAVAGPPADGPLPTPPLPRPQYSPPPRPAPSPSTSAGGERH